MSDQASCRVCSSLQLRLIPFRACSSVVNLLFRTCSSPPCHQLCCFSARLLHCSIVLLLCPAAGSPVSLASSTHVGSTTSFASSPTALSPLFGPLFRQPRLLCHSRYPPTCPTSTDFYDLPAGSLPHPASCLTTSVVLLPLSRAFLSTPTATARSIRTVLSLGLAMLVLR